MWKSDDARKWAKGYWAQLPPWGKITAQFLFELSLPAPFVYAVMVAKGEATLTSFMATYTAVGFAFVTLLRIVKQHRQDSGMRAMKDMLARLEAASEDLIGHATGGDAIPHLTFSSSKDQLGFSIYAAGKYALQHVHVDVVEIERFDATSSSGPVIAKFGPIDFLIPSRAQGIAWVPRSGQEVRRFNLYMSTRNGFFHWRVLCVWKHHPVTAVARSTAGALNEYEVPVGFPNYDPENPEALFDWN